MTSAPYSWNSNIVCVDFERKVLEGITVPDGLIGMGLCELQDLGIIARVVLDGSFTDLGNVEKTMEEVRSPVEVCLGASDGVPEAAHGL